jgi:hypothetical protein
MFNASKIAFLIIPRPLPEAFLKLLASMGTLSEAMEIKRPVQGKRRSLALTFGVPAEWMRLCTIWYDRSVYAQRSRAMSFYFLLNVGRWLGHTHPEATSPADWNRDLACEVVSVLCSGMAATGAVSTRPT